MVVIVLVLSVVCFGLAVVCLAHYVNMKNLEKQIRELKDSDSNGLLTIEAPEGKMRQVCFSINELLTTTRKRQIASEKKERELRSRISNISHDLRTPLTSLLGYIELAKKEEISKEQHKEYLSIVENRARILEELIVGVYDLSRMNENTFVLEQKEMSLASILYEVLALYYNEFEAKHYTCKLTISDKEAVIQGDRRALVRIYSNILQNVLRYGTGALFVSLKQKEGKIITRVGNTTDAMKKEDLPKVFDRFYLAKRLSNGQNTGLGLAIVKKLTELMGGQVHAELAGNVFSIVIEWPCLS